MGVRRNCKWLGRILMAVILIASGTVVTAGGASAATAPVPASVRVVGGPADGGRGTLHQAPLDAMDRDRIAVGAGSTDGLLGDSSYELGESQFKEEYHAYDCTAALLARGHQSRAAGQCPAPPVEPETTIEGANIFPLLFSSFPEMHWRSPRPRRGWSGRLLPIHLLWVNLASETSRWALDELGVDYTEVDAAGFATVNLADYDVLFVGSVREAPSDEYLQPLVDRKADIAAYVAAGGGLVVLGHSSEWRTPSTPLDWTWVPVRVTVELGEGRRHLIAPAHLIAQGLNDNNFSGAWAVGGQHFGAWDWPEATSLAVAGRDGDSHLLAGPYGTGRMVLCGSYPDLPWEHDLPLLANLFAWAAGELADVPARLADACPAKGAHAAAQSGLRLTFSEIVNRATVTHASIFVSGGGGPIAGQLLTSDVLNVVRFLPDDPFQAGETITVTVKAVIQDMTGNGLDGDGDGVSEGSPVDDLTWSFTVRSGKTRIVTSPDDEGPGTLRQAILSR